MRGTYGILWCCSGGKAVLSNHSLKWCKIDSRLFQLAPCFHGSEVPALLEHPFLAFGNLLFKPFYVWVALGTGSVQKFPVASKFGLGPTVQIPPSFKVETVLDCFSFAVKVTSATGVARNLGDWI